MSWNSFFFVCSRQNHDNYWQQNANAKSIIQVLTKTWHPNCELVDLSTLLSLNYLEVLHIVYINEYGFFHTNNDPPTLLWEPQEASWWLTGDGKSEARGPNKSITEFQARGNWFEQKIRGRDQFLRLSSVLIDSRSSFSRSWRLMGRRQAARVYMLGLQSRKLSVISTIYLFDGICTSLREKMETNV